MKDIIILRSAAYQSGVTDVVVATENPVQRYDDSRGYVVNEVLLMEGIVYRGDRNQIPIVDSHDDSTVRNILGSVRDLHVIDGELHGRPVFADDEDAQIVRQRMEGGHITDFSITAAPLESQFIPHGSQYTTKRGVVIDGPAIIHTRWQPHNASICTTGADELSTVRRSYTDLNREVKRSMDEALKGQLAALGLPEGMEDVNEILAWLLGKFGTAAPVEEVVENEGDKREEVAREMSEEEKKRELEAAVERAFKADAIRRKEIRSLCEAHKIERTFADTLCDERVDLNTARERILKRMATNPVGQSVERISFGEASQDKMQAAARDGLLKRSLVRVSAKQAEGVKLAPGHEDFSQMKLSRLAEMFVEQAGYNVRRMPDREVALVALGNRNAIERNRIYRDAYHTTGSFPALMLDVTNRTLQAGYEEHQPTWQIWARNAGTTTDFRSIKRVRLSESPMPEMVPEGKEYPESRMSDAYEEYSPHKYGDIFSVTWETIVNDDLDALSRIPASKGAACRRLQDISVYSILSRNPLMKDGGALFNATAQTTAGGHANLDTGAGNPPSVTTLNAAFVRMMTMKGLRSDVILSIVPRYLLVPVALSATADQLLASISDPSAGGSNPGNANTKNIYGPGSSRPLTLVVTPYLDASSATAWYLAADTSQVDTIEVVFLEGEETPVIETEWDFNTDTYKHKVRQTFGVAPIDFRGLYKHTNAAP